MHDGTHRTHADGGGDAIRHVDKQVRQQIGRDPETHHGHADQSDAERDHAHVVAHDLGPDGGHERAAKQHADAPSQLIGREFVGGGGQVDESQIQIDSLVFAGHEQQGQIHRGNGDETGQRVAQHHVAQIRPTPRVVESHLEIGEDTADAGERRASLPFGHGVRGTLRRRASLRHLDQRHEHDADDRRGHVDQQDRPQRHHVDEHGGHSRCHYHVRRVDHTVYRIDAQQFAGGHDVRDERLHGRRLDAAARRTDEQHHEDRGQSGPSHRETQRQHDGDGGDHHVRQHNQQFAIMAVRP